MENQEQKLHIQSNWLLFFLFLLFISRKDTKKLKIEEMNLKDLDKKAKFINRIKGYMDPEEQYILNNAETILQIIRSIKVLTETPKIEMAGVRYSSLSLEDRKRNMLMDLSEFLEDEKKLLVHQTVDFDLKVKTLEKRLMELHKLSQQGDHMTNIHDYIEIFEPILTEEAKEKVFEFKKMVSMLKAITSMRNKEKIDELDIMEIIQPFVNKDQRDSLMRMVQIFKAITSMKEENNIPNNDKKEEINNNAFKEEESKHVETLPAIEENQDLNK